MSELQATQVTALTGAVLQLLDCAEGLEKMLRLYVATVRFTCANDPNPEAAKNNFESNMAVMRQTPGLTGECVSPELDRLGEQVRSLVAQMGQELDKQSKPSHTP